MLQMLKRKRRWNHRLFLFVCGGGCLLPPAGNFLPFVPPAAHFSQQLEKWAKEPPKTNGFWISFCVQEHDLLWTVKGIDSATVPLPLPLRRRKYYVYRRGDPFPTVEQHVPSNSQCSGSVSRNTSIPCFGRTYAATLAPAKGSAETMGFCWRSLGTFCRYWQKVTRRRHKRKTAEKSMPSETAKKNCKGYYGSPRVLRTLAMTLLNVSK